jgi:hypothetical protein
MANRQGEVALRKAQGSAPSSHFGLDWIVKSVLQFQYQPHRVLSAWTLYNKLRWINVITVGVLLLFIKQPYSIPQHKTKAGGHMFPALAFSTDNPLRYSIFTVWGCKTSTQIQFAACTAMLIKNKGFWDVTGYKLVNSYQCSGGVCYLHLQGLAVQQRPRILNLEDGDNSFVQNV